MQTVTEISTGEVSPESASASTTNSLYSYKEAYQKSLDYFYGDELAAKVFVDKYALKDNSGNYVEDSPDAMHDRLASEFARIDSEKYGLDYASRFDAYRQALDKFARVVPQGSPMAAVGNNFQLMSASNCVVVDSPQDSISGIVRSGLELAQLYKRRCGVGIDISSLRPDGTSVNNAARTTSGAWSFADFYSYITRMIGQEGRRGALMITMDVHHPDVIKFATMKQDLTKVTGANVSVRLSDEFLQAVENDTEYELRWPCEGTPKIRKMIRAREVWDVIIKSATDTAEPGLILWGNMLKNLPPQCYEQFKTISTNPCSEIALSAYDSCRLISLNLTGYVRDPFLPSAKFDFDLFKKDIVLAMQMADNLVDLELELITKIKSACEDDIDAASAKLLDSMVASGVSEEIIEETKNRLSAHSEMALWNRLYAAGQDGRRTGLGTHGLGDTLCQLRLRYDSAEALTMVEQIYETLRNTAYGASIDLAERRGPFPVFDWTKEKDCEFIKRLPEDLQERMAKAGRRNIALLTQAPTGSVSIISKVGNFPSYNVSSGVEPVFRNTYVRRKKINKNDQESRVDFVDDMGDKWQEFWVFHSNVTNFLDSIGIKVTADKFEDTVRLPNFFVTSDQIDWQRRVALQGTEQQFIDHSISSTINLPKGTPADVVGSLYLSAWRQGLKGVTVYVDGSRTGVLVTDEDEEQKDDGFHERSAPRRPTTLTSETHKIKVDFGDGSPRNAYVTISFFPGTKRPYELFVVAPHQGLDEKDQQILELTARNTSMNLRHGVPLRYICEQLDKVGGQYIFSIPTNIAKLLRLYDTSIPVEEATEHDEACDEEEPVSKKQAIEPSHSNGSSNGNGKHLSSSLAKCPSCHKRTYILAGGCGHCVDPECAYSGCS
jgi:ribonucleoside-diphosphate reductase alpha chain